MQCLCRFYVLNGVNPIPFKNLGFYLIGSVKAIEELFVHVDVGVYDSEVRIFILFCQFPYKLFVCLCYRVVSTVFSISACQQLQLVLALSVH